MYTNIMKWSLISIILCLMTGCKNSGKNPTQKNGTIINDTYQVDTLKIDSQIVTFKLEYDSAVKELYDSVARFESDGIDFSDITTGIEKKHNASNNEFEQRLIGYELAKNYLLCFRNSDNKAFNDKADSLFFSFISYENGAVASRYLSLDVKRIQFMQKNWEKFSELDKETLLFYGLLRGFNNGLPDVLKNIE